MNIFNQELRNAPCGIVFNENDEVLLVQSKAPSLKWGPPAGFPEYGESPSETIEREVAEETGISCEVIAPLGDCEYPELNTRLVIYVCMSLFGSIICPGEAAAVKWFSMDSLPENLSLSADYLYKAYELYRISTGI